MLIAKVMDPELDYISPLEISPLNICVHACITFQTWLTSFASEPAASTTALKALVVRGILLEFLVAWRNLSMYYYSTDMTREKLKSYSDLTYGFVNTHLKHGLYSFIVL